MAEDLHGKERTQGAALKRQTEESALRDPRIAPSSLVLVMPVDKKSRKVDQAQIQ